MKRNTTWSPLIDSIDDISRYKSDICSDWIYRLDFDIDFFDKNKKKIYEVIVSVFNSKYKDVKFVTSNWSPLNYKSKIFISTDWVLYTNIWYNDNPRKLHPIRKMYWLWYYNLVYETQL